MSLLEASFEPPLPPPSAGAPPAPPSLPAGIDIKEWAAKYNGEEPVLFQIIVIGDSTCVWVGTSEMTHNSLALAMPSMRQGQMPTGTTLLGANHADAGAQRMAQRLTKRLGKPIFLSLNVRDEPELRQFAEANVLKALQALAPAPASTPAVAPAAAPAAAAPAAAPPDATATAAATTTGTSGEPSGAGVRKLEVFADSESLQARAAALLLAAADDAIAQRGRFCVALSGGSIPKLLSPPLLAAGGTGAVRFDLWHVFLADERYVDESDPESSMGVWRQQLLHAARVPPAQIHALDVSLPLEAAAAKYEAEVLALLAPPPPLPDGEAPDDLTGAPAVTTVAPPAFDCVVLGMGPDGHTASLFPGHELLHEAARVVAPISDSPKPPPQRVTLTLPVLNAARLAVFIATGASKAEKLKLAFEPDTELPAGLVVARQTHWLVDRPAAADLEEREQAADHLYG